MSASNTPPLALTRPRSLNAALSAVVASVGSAVAVGANQARLGVPPWPAMPARMRSRLYVMAGLSFQNSEWRCWSAGRAGCFVIGDASDLVAVLEGRLAPSRVRP